MPAPGGPPERAPAAAVVTPSATVSRDVRSPPETEPPVPSASTLTAERALLDVAHAALGDGRAAEALTALRQHARRFPHGVYREEREALAIQCLRALGRSSEAAARSAAIKARYPRSLFLSVVEQPSGTNP